MNAINNNKMKMKVKLIESKQIFPNSKSEIGRKKIKINSNDLNEIEIKLEIKEIKNYIKKKWQRVIVMRQMLVGYG